jgi:predicted ATPase
LGLKSYYGGLASDARKLLAESLDLARTAGDDRRTGEALSAMGHVDEFQGKFSQADVRFRASVETLEKIDEQYHRGYSLNNRGRAVYAMGDYALAERLVESALAIRRRAGDEVAIAYSLLDLGTVALMAGDYGRADENVEESLAIGRRLGLLDTEARCFNALGTLHRARRQYAEAADAHQRSLDIYRETNVPRDLPHTLNGLAAVALAQGQLEKVHEYLQESLEIAAELDNIGHRAEALNLMGNLAAAESRWQEAREHYRQALEITEETGARPLALEILVGVAALHLNGPEPNPPRAADLLNLVQGHPAATRETREKAEALSSSGVLTPGSRGVEDSSLEAAVAQIVAEEPVVAPEARHNLPVQTTPFLGREEELARLEELLTQPAVRLITIVGPGGIGKTRLSLAAAERARRFRDGVTFVPLAPLESAANIVSAIAEAVDFRFFGELDPWRQLLNYLAPKGMLLVLDNFEHLLDGGADLVAELLAEAPGVKLLTTSRERLHLTGEAVYRIAGLPYPEGELPMGRELSQYGAVALLLQQAGLMRPGEAPDEAELVDMAHICRLVQGMPLAIILAAGWLEALSFKEIADEIASNLDILESENRDMPSRQRSVRAAFAYSWDQLSQDERAVFMKLSVFRGGFSRRAAGEVAGARLRALRALVEKSLLVASRSERYEVHELLRQYAAEKLDESGEQEHIQTAHSIYYLRALGELEEDIKGGRQVEAIAEIDADLENVRAAWIWAVRHRMASAIDDGLEAYYLHMYIRGRHQEGAELLGIARATWETRQESRLLGRIIARQILALIRPQQGGPQFVADLNRSVAVAEAHGDAFEAALATLALGYYHSRLHSDNEAARPYFQASCEQFRRLGDDFYLAFALVRLGYAESTLGGTQGDSYLDHTRQGLELAKKMGNKMQVVSGSVNLGTDRLMQGEYELAERLSNDAFVAGTEMRFKVAQAQSRTILSLLHLVRGELDRGRELATWALAMAKEVNFPLTQGYALSALAVAASLRGEYDEALQLGEESLARPSNPQGEWPARWAQCIAHCGLAQLALARQKLATNLRVAVEYRWLGPMTWLLPVAALLEYRAGRHARAVELLSLAMHHPLSATGWMAHWAPAAEMRAGLAGKLDAADYATAWERGKGLELEGTAAALLAESSG